MKTADAPPKAETGTAEISEQEFASSWRVFDGWKKATLFWAAAIFAAFHIVNLNYLALDSILFRAVHLCGGAALGFLMVSADRKSVV